MIKNITEWYEELSTIKKILLGMPVAVILALASLWAFAQFFAESTPKPTAKKVMDQEIERREKEDKELEQTTQQIKKEIKSLRKEGEINDTEYQRYKTDLIDAGFDISRVNALLARTREHRRNRSADRRRADSE